MIVIVLSFLEVFELDCVVTLVRAVIMLIFVVVSFHFLIVGIVTFDALEKQQVVSVEGLNSTLRLLIYFCVHIFDFFIRIFEVINRVVTIKLDIYCLSVIFQTS